MLSQVLAMEHDSTSYNCVCCNKNVARLEGLVGNSALGEPRKQLKYLDIKYSCLQYVYVSEAFEFCDAFE